jgi:hypothetical protein
VEAGIVQVVDAELHQHEVRLVADSQVSEERCLVEGVVAADAEIDDLERR